MASREHIITLTLWEGDFEMSMGRTPHDDAEFEEWAHLCEKGLLNGHIDWDILYGCTREAMLLNQGVAGLGSLPDRRKTPRTVPSEEAP